MSNDGVETAIDSGWPTFYRSEGLYEVLPSFVAGGHDGDAAAVDTAFEQTTTCGEGVSVKVWGDLKDHPHATAWQRLSQECNHPRSVCRFADLAWCANPSDHESAQIAIAAYRECANSRVLDELDAAPEEYVLTMPDGSPVVPEPGAHWCFGSYRLRRARQIALAIRDATLIEEITAQTQVLIIEQLNKDHGQAACRLFDVVLHPKTKRPTWFVDVAVRILDQLGDAPVNWTTQLVEELRTTVAPTSFDGDWPAFLNQLQLNALVANANSRDGAAQWKLLGDAAKFAEDRGMNDEARRLLQEWNTIDPNSFLKKIRVETPLPPEFAEQQEEMIKAMTNPVTDAASAIACLAAPLPARLGIPIQPSLRSGLGLSSQTISEGRTSILTSHEDLHRLETMKAGSQAALWCADTSLIPALNRIHGKIGFNLNDWEEAWSGPFVDDKAAARLADATRLFYENRCDTATHLLCPTIEQMLRRIAWAVQVVEPRPPQPGHDYIPPTLIPILEKLEEHIDESRRVWFQHLLVDSMGFNLRNKIAHGTASLGDCKLAALLLNAAAWLSCLAIETANDK